MGIFYILNRLFKNSVQPDCVESEGTRKDKSTPYTDGLLNNNADT